MDILTAITSRRSVRAFTPQDVPDETIRAILSAAARAPSGSNIQPWRVYVLKGEAKRTLSATLHADRNAHPDEETPQYQYYPTKWREPYQSRRRKVGWDLYSLVGIQRGEHEKMFRQHGRNFDFFDAPVGLIFTIDADLEQGSWLDYGIFLQTVMLAARAYGLDTCPQAAWAYHHVSVRKAMDLPESELVVCGISLGYADEGAIENTLTTERMTLDQFVTFRE
jgi:nitroreductase